MSSKKVYDETKALEREYLFLRARGNFAGIHPAEVAYTNNMASRALAALNSARRKNRLGPYGETAEQAELRQIEERERRNWRRRDYDEDE